jgi:hypothetical protein
MEAISLHLGDPRCFLGVLAGGDEREFERLAAEERLVHRIRQEMKKAQNRLPRGRR